MVFDFDHTVVDDNSDTWVIKYVDTFPVLFITSLSTEDVFILFFLNLRCLPDQRLPDTVRRSYPGQWTEYMGRVMRYIGESS